ncbi:helix-turn-helix domain-containing protein [Planctobacterium marinum]|uniref:HTH araC/xylS-type domain-containing protein n=1 Tax=Planctobacterium marinum TaxID=1631968 RepID=A0AA48KRW5_9ALTE|nr:hypothetical protein MACH26_13750 [Planctobacterium marinum]
MEQTFLGIIYFIALSHGLMLAVSLLRRTTSRAPSRWLTIIAFVICYKLYEGGVLYTGLYEHVVHSIGLLPYMVLIIGPLIWLYVRQVTGKKALPRWLLVANFVPAMVIWLLNSPAVFRGSQEKVASWNVLLNSTGGDLPTVYIALLLSIKAHLGIYLYLSWRSVSKFKSVAINLRADNSSALLSNMQFIVVAFFVLELTWVSLFTAQQLFGLGTLNAVGDIWLLFVAFMVLAIGYIGLQQPDLVFTPEECKLAEQQGVAENTPDSDKSNVKYFHSALPQSTSEILSKELEQQIQSQKLYLNERLTLTDLAKATNMKAHTLSQIINQSMKTNFYKLINGYRIQYAVDLIEDNTVTWSLERIALESGFNNRVTFSKAFKEIMDCTPSAYKKKHQTDLESAGG